MPNPKNNTIKVSDEGFIYENYTIGNGEVYARALYEILAIYPDGARREMLSERVAINFMNGVVDSAC